MPADDYRQASLRIWDEMAAGWEDHRGTVWRRLEPYAEGDGYRLPGRCLNVLAA